MKFFIQLIAIMVAAFVLELLLPWWCIALAAFGMGYVVKSKANFLAGFFAIALLWSAMALYLDSSAATELIEKVAAIFTITKPVLMVITALLGGLVGGFAAMAGASLKKEKRRYY
jgi:hypothetical protein